MLASRFRAITIGIKNTSFHSIAFALIQLGQA